MDKKCWLVYHSGCGIASALEWAEKRRFSRSDFLGILSWSQFVNHLQDGHIGEHSCYFVSGEMI